MILTLEEKTSCGHQASVMIEKENLLEFILKMSDQDLKNTIIKMAEVVLGAAADGCPSCRK